MPTALQWASSFKETFMPPTTLCGAAGSTSKPGVGSSVIIPVSLIAGGLALVSPWLIPVAAFLEGYTFDLVAGCAADPPPLPTWSAADLGALAGGVLNPNFAGLLAKVNAVVQHYFWYEYCQCVSPAVTPPRPPVPLPPAGIYVPTPNGTRPCFSGSYAGLIPSPGQPLNGQVYADVSRLLLPIGTAATIPSGVIPPIDVAYPIPAGVTHLEWHYTKLGMSVPCGGTGLQGYITFHSSTGAFFPNIHLGNDPQGGTASGGGMEIPAGATHYRAYLTGDDGFCGFTVGQATINVEAWCAGTRPGSPTDCCPPDPALLNLVQQVYQLEQLILSGMSGAIHSYADSTVHAGLTGAGSFALQSAAIAVRADVVSSLPVDRQYVGNPTYYFDIGHVTPIINAAPLKGQRLVYRKQLMPLPALTDSIGYTFSQGVTVNITELVKGP